MKTILKNVIIAAGIFILTACSGGGSYSPEKCAALAEKIGSKQELTEADYTEMIDQLDGIIRLMKEKDKEFGGDKEKEREFSKSEEGKNIGKYFLTFGFYLDSHTDQLSNANKKKINKIMAEYEEEAKKK